MAPKSSSDVPITCCPFDIHPNDVVCKNPTLPECQDLVDPKQGPGKPANPKGRLSEITNQLERQLEEALRKNMPAVAACRVALAIQLLEDGFPEHAAFVAQQISETANASVFQQSLLIRQHALIQLNNIGGANQIRKRLKRLINSPIK